MGFISEDSAGGDGIRGVTHGSAQVFIDGGARGNPGEAGCGVILRFDDGSVEEDMIYLGQATNNVAEYAALLAALERALALGVREVDVHSASELLVKQMTGAYRVKAAHLHGHGSAHRSSPAASRTSTSLTSPARPTKPRTGSRITRWTAGPRRCPAHRG